MLNEHIFYSFIYLRIYVLKYITFILFILLNCIISTLRNVKYQFKIKYSNNNHIILNYPSDLLKIQHIILSTRM